jgi:hypothetical protein
LFQAASATLRRSTPNDNKAGPRGPFRNQRPQGKGGTVGVSFASNLARKRRR